MKKIQSKRFLSFVLAFSLILSLILTLSSCGTYGGSGDLLTKSELLSTVSAAEDEGLEYAADYLDRWSFPRFLLGKMRGLENVFNAKFVEELPSPFEKAKDCALAFLENYYEDTELSNPEEVTDALIRAYVSTVGDRYSVYRTKSEYKDYLDSMKGSFVGIGVTVRYSDGDVITVVKVHSDSGAEQAGILPDDLIISVDGKKVSDIGYTEAVNAIRGEENSTVKIEVQRDGKELEFEVVRKRITEESVFCTVEDGIAYVTITGFKESGFRQFKEIVDSFEENGVVGVVYDLRSNPGGYLNTVTDMLDYIAPKGTKIASFSNNYKKDEISKSEHSLSLPTVVLCNGETASAAELFTSAIRDFSDMGFFEATVVGEKTFGKGIMQNTYTFSDGSAITLTVAYYNPPSGINYHGVGITPDIIAENTDGDGQMEAAKAEILHLTALN